MKILFTFSRGGWAGWVVVMQIHDNHDNFGEDPYDIMFTWLWSWWSTMISMMGCGWEDGWEESGELGRSLPGLWSQSPPSQAPPCFSKCLSSSNVYKFPRSNPRSQSQSSPQQAPRICFQNVSMFSNIQSLVSVFNLLILHKKLNPLFSHRPFFQNVS